LRQILKETGKRTEDLIKDLQRFSASESIEQIDIVKNGKRRNSATQVVNYIVLIEQNSSSYPSVEEYRSGTNGIRQAPVVDTGVAALALIFHPTHLGSFDFRCEGLSELRGSPAWQVHFEQKAGPTNAFQALRIGPSLYLPRMKGRAWIATDSYAVLRIETDLMSPIPLTDLQLEHQVIVYSSVEFQKRHVRLWLPESTSLYIAHRGHRYVRVLASVSSSSSRLMWRSRSRASIEGHSDTHSFESLRPRGPLLAPSHATPSVWHSRGPTRRPPTRLLNVPIIRAGNRLDGLKEIRRNFNHYLRERFIHSLASVLSIRNASMKLGS
jgi:hypothetical protein